MAQFNKQNGAQSFVVNCFEDFYKQVLRHKQFVFSKPWEKEKEKITSSPNATAEYILSNLQTFLEEQAVTVSFGGNGFAENYYTEAQFVMVALGDEVFLNLDWPGKTYWESNLLEQRFYNTHSAGQTFFEKLDLLLQNQDPVRTDLAILYLNALALGFQGKYRHFNDANVLASYRKKLFTFINRREPYLFRQKIHLFSDAYAHTLEGNGIKELPNMRNWYFVFSGICLAYLLASSIVWYRATSDIKSTLNHIITYNSVD
ncbi:MAG: DotU family type IV/VI secretion system protein [Proteobacteria bacterium]|nr:DotU family type IV/VI secretion system protein [Pseudomonadota bacterium]